jgi:putative membrane protein insertion efficiency factor
MNAATGSWRHWPRRGLTAAVRGYRLLLSPWLGNQCRFAPTCSVYAIEALERHGALAGTYLAGARLMRCAPWCAGGCDPVPAERPRLFTHLLPAATVAQPVADPFSTSSRPLP